MPELAAHQWLMIVLLFVAGTICGRIANRFIVRLPEHFDWRKAIRFGFSTEPRLGKQLPTRWYHALPIIGTATIVGRSPFSGRRVLAREPWLELLNGLLFVVAYLFEIPPSATDLMTSGLQWKYGLTTEGVPVGLTEYGFLHVRLLYHLLLFEFLWVATFIDFDLFIIPDGVTVPGMIVGLGGMLIMPTLYVAPVWFEDPYLIQTLDRLVGATQSSAFTEYGIPLWVRQAPFLHGAVVSLVGFVIGGGTIWAIRLIGFWVLKQEAMGFGDVILMAMVGLYTGWQPIFPAIIVGALLSLVIIILEFAWNTVAKKEYQMGYIPFGPYLSAGVILTLLGWKWVWPFSEKLMSSGIYYWYMLIVMGVIMGATLMLLQVLKRILGIETEYFWETERWSLADQQWHYQSKYQTDPRNASLKPAEHSLKWSGRGQLQQRRWYRRN